ncbi:MAG TPA: alpha,alpha-trehalase TreF [Saprospiraceae bacterium]|nr:alpha,alpha-trehalase TreF [Saprospiraceae bacterium]
MFEYLPPDKIFGELFEDILSSNMYGDNKTVADLIPLIHPDHILKNYFQEKNTAKFDLERFVNQHFKSPHNQNPNFKSDISQPIEYHIDKLWTILTRDADEIIFGSSLIPLPFPYVVPGGRFNEIYYWDSYFTMLGLKVCGKIDLIDHMINNFAWLIDQIGYIPNGNRTYYIGRSQPPYFSLMVHLLSQIKGHNILGIYLPQLVKEYRFWMEGQSRLKEHSTIHRLAWTKGHTLNRYWDNRDEPRQEMWATDQHHAQKLKLDERKRFFRNIRAACESGWDFSSRWLKVPNDLTSIQTTDILPVDLNCLLWFLEHTIEEACNAIGDLDMAKVFAAKAAKRKTGIIEIFWSDEHSYFMDFNISEQKHTPICSLAGTYPLFMGIALSHQAKAVMQKISKDFLYSGGLVTTLNQTGQQWDAPNGWAPLQWICFEGLRKYGYSSLANDIRSRWMALNEKVFVSSGKMLEKYNVIDPDLVTGGGEYPVQDGFGWTNGVYMAMKHSL